MKDLRNIFDNFGFVLESGAKDKRDGFDAIPYGILTFKLLESIFDALKYCSRQWIYDKAFEATDEKLVKCFKWTNPHPHQKGKKNNHFFEKIGSDDKGPMRLAALTVARFKQLQRDARPSSNKKGVSLMIPSPLSILYEALIVPNEPASRAYALAACRLLLFLRLRVCPPGPRIHPPYENEGNWKRLDIDKLETELDSHRRYFSHRDNFPLASNFTAKVLQHFFAMKGYYCLRFGTWEEGGKRENIGKSVPPEIGKKRLWLLVKTYLDQRDITGQVIFKNVKGGDFFKSGVGSAFEFRLSPSVVDPPRALDVINEIVGIPIPIRGADTLLFGGLRTSTDEGLVVNVSGAAGTGKTSFALAVAATLSPFDTHCYYITTEEASEDLKGRLMSLIPSYLRGLSIYKQKIDDWFHVADLRSLKRRSKEGQPAELLAKYLEEVIHLVQETRKKAENKLTNDQHITIPAIAPLVVVIDSIFGLAEKHDVEEFQALSEFIVQCRGLKALVFVLSGEELSKHSRLSYMVDVICNLTYRDTESENKKPERILQLTKTRFQISRPGAHVFHMSGREGLRISPQLSSQLDKEEQRNLTMPDKKQIINALNDWRYEGRIDTGRYDLDKNCQKSGKYLDLYAYSHVLVHGHGSTGKAAIGLKILLSKVPVNDGYNRVAKAWNESRRVLVVSFLYPESYYEERAKKIDNKAQVEILAFSPGFLLPQDLMSKVSRKIEEAELCGNPFTGVLLDGLHNVFLSFPVLQDNEMVWPSLYRFLSIKKQTIVTTFTTFTLDLMDQINNTPEEMEMHRKRQSILLHALVQSADFYITVGRYKEHIAYGPDCYLQVREIIGKQKHPEGLLLWDRHNCTFSSPVIQRKKEN
jgi:KaiC/GvpD/RAD55 family RecA-like ATPase